jgi:hypothetical protein
MSTFENFQSIPFSKLQKLWKAETNQFLRSKTELYAAVAAYVANNKTSSTKRQSRTPSPSPSILEQAKVKLAQLIDKVLDLTDDPSRQNQLQRLLIDVAGMKTVEAVRQKHLQVDALLTAVQQQRRDDEFLARQQVILLQLEANAAEQQALLKKPRSRPTSRP